MGRVRDVKLSYCATAYEDSARIYDTLRGVPDLSHLRIWGCKAYLRLPKNYIRKDWRDKTFSGYFIGYNEPGEMGYRLFIPDLRDTVVGVNVTFNEVVPSYREEYYIEVAPDVSTVESFHHLVGAK